MNVHQLATTLFAPGVRAVALFGSHARGDAGPYSDVDLVRFVDESVSLSGAGTHLLDGMFVNVSDVTSQQYEAWFVEPNHACNTIAGLRAARALLDPDQLFVRLQARAHAFVWDNDMQQRANVWASNAMVGWIEEAHKGLEGLRRNDVGRMLNARHGLSWGLMGVVQVQRGVLVDGDNSVIGQVSDALDVESATLLRAAFGVNPIPLHEQVRAGLQLYGRIATLLNEVWSPQHVALIQATAASITQAL